MMFRKKNYWQPNSPLLINTNQFKEALGDDKYIVVDGGAAGDVEEPFNKIRDVSKFVRFEPSGSDTVNLGDDIFVDGGLWDKDETRELHIAKRETTSSIYPPNKDFLENFDNRYGLPPRSTIEKVRMNLRSIDSAVSNSEMPKPNFIKLDIHSAEYEAVLGSTNSLSNNLGFLIETWHSEVHKGQHLHAEIESFLASVGYEVFDTRTAAAWKYNYEGKISSFDKPRYIGSEMLFFRKEIPEHLELKYIGLCDLFNFSNLARTVIARSKLDSIKTLKSDYESIIKRKYYNWLIKDFGIVNEIKDIIKKMVGRYSP